MLARRLLSMVVVGALAHAACANEPGRDARSASAGTSIGGAAGRSDGGSVGLGGLASSSSASTGGMGGSPTSGASTTSATSGGAGGVGGSASGGGGGTGGTAGGGTGGLSGLGPPQFRPGELDAPSNGGTITFQNIGKTGWFPSRRDPATGPCDFSNAAGCCKTRFNITSDKLTPWDEDLIMTLRGPLVVKQLVTYQASPGAASWQVASAWDDRSASTPKGIGFSGNKTETVGFNGVVGTECLVDASSDRAFPCGPASVPYCPPPGTAKKYYGWEGSKMIVLLAFMPYADSGKIAAPCSQNNTGNWYNAPWIGLSVGELVRSGAFGTCQCYSATDPNAGDGCGQFNVFETVNDNNSFRNFDVFSTNFFGYAGYVGEGPCGASCKANLFPAAADLIDKSTSVEVAQGVVTGPGKPVGAAFRRPESGYRYFVILLDVDTRTVQLAIVHPQKIPAALGSFLPNLPAQIARSAVDAALALRLPK